MSESSKQIQSPLGGLLVCNNERFRLTVRMKDEMGRGGSESTLSPALVDSSGSWRKQKSLYCSRDE